MAIDLIREDEAALKAWGLGLEKLREKCYFCLSPTVFWHKKSNLPVCECCGLTRHESELLNRHTKI